MGGGTCRAALAKQQGCNVPGCNPHVGGLRQRRPLTGLYLGQGDSYKKQGDCYQPERRSAPGLAWGCDHRRRCVPTQVAGALCEFT